MGIGIKCYTDIAMAKSSTYYLRVNALLEHQAGMGMAQIMESDVGKSGLLHNAAKWWTLSTYDPATADL